MRHPSLFRTFNRLLLGLTLALCWVSAGRAADPFDYGFSPWDAVLGRDGRFYGKTMTGGTFRGGLVYSITSTGAVRVISSFPRLRVSPNMTRTGIYLEAPLSVGQDGALYGATREGGALGTGTIFKLEPNGRRTVLYHFSYADRKTSTLAASNGNIYCALMDGRVVRLAPDGSVKETVLPREVRDVIETATGEIVAANFTYVNHIPNAYSATGGLFRLTQAEEWQQFADLGSYIRTMLPMPDGSFLAATTKLLQVYPDGTFTELHDFSAAFEGLGPMGLFLAQDGSIIGHTREGGLEGQGAVFRVVPSTKEFTVLGHLPAPDARGKGPAWMEAVFPLRAEAAEGNRPPAARTDFIGAGTLRARPRTGDLPKVQVAVLRNDSDADGDPLTITAIGTPQHGTAIVNADGRTITYTSSTGEPEWDTFSYTIADGQGGTAVGRVVIRPNRAGRYQGQFSTRPNPATGDPGTVVGSLNVRVNARGVLAGRMRLFDRSHDFTGQVNDHNLFGTPIAFNPGTGRRIGLQLWLKPVGSGWRIEAQALRDSVSYYATAETGSTAN